MFGSSTDTRHAHTKSGVGAFVHFRLTLPGASMAARPRGSVVQTQTHGKMGARFTVYAPEDFVVVLVVAGHGDQTSKRHTQRVEVLGRCVHPHLPHTNVAG